MYMRQRGEQRTQAGHDLNIRGIWIISPCSTSLAISFKMLSFQDTWQPLPLIFFPISSLGKSCPTERVRALTFLWRHSWRRGANSHTGFAAQQQGLNYWCGNSEMLSWEKKVESQFPHPFQRHKCYFNWLLSFEILQLTFHKLLPYSEQHMKPTVLFLASFLCNASIKLSPIYCQFWSFVLLFGRNLHISWTGNAISSSLWKLLF